MKKIILAMLMAACLPCAAKTVKIAFVADSGLSPKCSAILNGLRDCAAEISKRDAVSIKVEFMFSESARGQAAALSNVYLGGYSGAVVAPAQASEELMGKIAELSKAGFAVVLLGDAPAPEGALCSISTDRRAAAEMLGRIVKKYARADTAIYCYFSSSQNAAGRVSGGISALSQDALESGGFAKAFGGRPLKVEAFDFYSVYAQQNAVEILRRDNFAEVFFAPGLLGNMTPVKSDMDRNFAVCIGAMPWLEFHFATGFLTACIYDDFYGWGVFAARAIIDKTQGAGGIKSRRLVPPILATKDNYSVFVSDWRKWLR